MNLAELLLGEKILTDAQKASGWADKARALSARYAPKPAYVKAKRFEGQDIHFPVKRGYPEVWIKTVKFSGGTDRTRNPEYIHLQGIARNISSNQRLDGEAMTVSLSGTKGGAFSLAFDAFIDRRAGTPFEKYSAQMTGLSLGAFNLGKSDFLPPTISQSTLAVDIIVTLPGGEFEARGDLRFRSMVLTFQAEPRNIGERLAREVLEGVTGFDAGFRIGQQGNKADAAFTTDLDNQFRDGIKRIAGAELTKTQNQIRARASEVGNPDDLLAH